MSSQPDLVTVYSSADRTAELDASSVRNVLIQNGMEAVLCDDTAPGVPEGTWEVRVPGHLASEASSLVAETQMADESDLDVSEDLDSVTIAELQGMTGEIEALGIKSILDASGIPSVVVGNSTLPNLSFLIKVPRSELQRAEAVLAEARAAGPAAAVQGERESEEQAPPLL